MKITQLVWAFGCGLMFGLGLFITNMSNPQKVLAFLDVEGDWDASLAFVMASALLVLGLAQRYWLKELIIINIEANQCGGGNSSLIDKRLIAGACLFGLGWGLAGICPGPALAGLSSGLSGSYVFVAAMFAGFAAFNFWSKR